MNDTSFDLLRGELTAKQLCQLRSLTLHLLEYSPQPHRALVATTFAVQNMRLQVPQGEHLVEAESCASGDCDCLFKRRLHRSL